MDPSFSGARLSLLDRGFVFAIAHIRGGGEMGRQWYEQGKLAAKPNTFTDFTACAEHLIAEGWTTAGAIVARGGSAGGLLMGAIVNQRPDLYAGIVAQVPFVDALTTILDPSLPLTVMEWEEWGNPVESPEIYAVMKSYAPYDNVDRSALSPDPRDGRAERPAGVLLGAGEVGAAAARADHLRRADPAQDRDGRRPRRAVGSLRRLARGGVPLAFALDCVGLA